MENVNKIFLKVAGIILLMLSPMTVKAQYMTELYLTDVNNDAVKTAAQQNIGKLLTQFNIAYTDSAAVKFEGIDIIPAARKTIEDMWQNSPFRCGETEIIERCLHTHDGNFQIRNLPVFIKDNEGKEEYQEVVINFNKKGTITDFHTAISSNLYVKVIKKGSDVTDLRYRQIILDYVEQFRTAYNTKDMPFLEQIYSDDALIITGKVIKTAPSEMNNFMSKEKVVYNKQSKKEYLTNLARVFKINKRIHVVFDDLKVMKHPAKEGYYGVTLKQGYSSDNYSDIGYLFLLWDFNNPDAPQIHVRTWQPEMLNATTKLPEEEIFTCNDFDIK